MIVIQLYGFQRFRLGLNWKAEETPTFPVRVCDCDQIVFILLSISLRLDRLQSMDVTEKRHLAVFPFLLLPSAFSRTSKSARGREARR